MNQQAIEKLNRVKEQIRAFPDAFDMTTWDCGTTACIAGWICRNANSEWTGSGPAAQILGLAIGESYGLWFTDRWPWEIAEKYSHARCSTMKAEAACEAIDAFIEDPGQFDHTISCNAMYCRSL